MEMPEYVAVKITPNDKATSYTLEVIPNAEFAHVVRCKDCRYYAISELKLDGTEDKRYKPSVCVLGEFVSERKPDWFCADGVKVNG